MRDTFSCILDKTTYVFKALKIDFYASAQRSVTRGILFLSCLSVCASVRPCVRPKTLLTRYLAEYLTHFHKRTYTNDDRDECVIIWGQKVKVQGHGGITYAGTVTAQAEVYSTRCLVSS